MATKAEKDRQKQIQDKCQALLTEMLRDEDNKYCVDCDAKGPRWASWNLGIFLCIRCAGIHRNLGVHISKVKSVNLDTWTPEQVVSLQQMGNSRARAVYEANLPDNFRRPQTDSSLESFVRAKYEQKKYIAREWVPPTIPKINWDQELDEEAERQRRRKKEAKQQQQIRRTVNTLTEIPQLLPKPKGSVSPKPSRTSGESARTAPKSATQDLLGLDTPVANSLPMTTTANGSNGDDIFSSFLSAPPAAPPVLADKKDLDTGRSAEEESFFNQPTPSCQEKRQLTKDSILALYSAAPAQTKPVTAPMFGVPGGLYTQQQGGFSQPAPPAMVFGMPTQPLPNGMYAPTGMSAQTSLASNPFFNMGAAAAASTGFPQMAQEHDPSSSNQDLMLDFGKQITIANLASQQLPQQMARMNLGGPMVAPMGHTQPIGVQIPGLAMNLQQQHSTAPTLFQQAPNPGHTLATNLWQ